MLPCIAGWQALRTMVWRLVAGLALAAGPAPSWLIAADADPFAQQLAELAARCDELGLTEQARITRGWQLARSRGRQYLFLPAADDPAAPKAGAPEVVRQWYARFRAIRREQAERLFAAAQERCRDDAGEAYRLLFAVLREDPDHAAARRVLGYDKSPRGEWTLTGGERLVPRQGTIDHPTLGWRARGYWRLETPHFQIVTNHSAREALEAGRQLEQLAALWRQLFFRFWSTPAALAARLAGGSEPLARPRPPMQVVLFKTRGEYVAQLASAGPQIADSLGYYSPAHRTAYFFAGDTSVYPTWYHEAAHQLFSEAAADTTAEPGKDHNFWAIEGAALYMESLTEHAGYWTAGGCEADRLQLARYRALSGEFLMPLGQLTGLSREAFQQSPDLRKQYAQAAGVAHFLMDGQECKRREAFLDLLAAIYRDAARPGSLATLTGESFPALDQAYLEFLNVTDDDLAGIPSPERLKNLSLGRTQVTDRGLAHLAACRGLEWLDLSLTQTGDAGLKAVAGAARLRQLFLEGTRVTAASLPLISGFKNLEELDLARLPIHDADLAALAELKKLRALYLTGCPITDAALPHLKALKQVEILEVSGTQLSPEAQERLRAALPKRKAP